MQIDILNKTRKENVLCPKHSCRKPFEKAVSSLVTVITLIKDNRLKRKKKYF